MRLLALFLAAAFASTGKANKCQFINGQSLIQYSGRTLPIRFPCNFVMVKQTCGDYLVRLTPGLTYLYPTYRWDTIWLSVENIKTGNVYEGRSTDKVAAKYIISKALGQDRPPWNDVGGNLAFTSLFKVSHTTGDVTITTQDGTFSITVGPYDFNGNAFKDSRIVFQCNAANVPAPFPTQYCGSTSGEEIKERSRQLFLDDPGLLDYVVLFDVFNDTDIAQESPLCVEATSVFTGQCQTLEKKRSAIAVCEKIIASSAHTQCVVRKACNPMTYFVACLKYVCSDYKDNAACAEVGAGIDLCREIRGVNKWDLQGLTQRVRDADCYKDLLTQEDNPYYSV